MNKKRSIAISIKVSEEELEMIDYVVKNTTRDSRSAFIRNKILDIVEKELNK